MKTSNLKSSHLSEYTEPELVILAFCGHLGLNPEPAAEVFMRMFKHTTRTKKNVTAKYKACMWDGNPTDPRIKRFKEVYKAAEGQLTSEFLKTARAVNKAAVDDYEKSKILSEAHKEIKAVGSMSKAVKSLSEESAYRLANVMEWGRRESIQTPEEVEEQNVNIIKACMGAVKTGVRVTLRFADGIEIEIKKS